MQVMQATSAPPRRSNPHSMRIAAFAFCFGAMLIAGCSASAADVRPPDDQMFFPTGIAVSPDDQVLYVASSNSQLRYDTGTVLVFDLNQIKARVDAWVPADPTVAPDAGPCAQDPDQPTALVCNEAPFVLPAAGVRIGNFATQIAIQDMSGATGDPKYRLFVPTRGDPSVSWIDYDMSSKQLSCAAGTDTFAECDDAHRLEVTLQDLDNTHLNDEPFGVFADFDPATQQGFAVVSHQTNGAVTLIDAPASDNVSIADIKYNVFNADVLTGIRGSTGVAGRRGVTPSDDLIYISSRTDQKVQTFTIGRGQNIAPPYFVASNFIELDQIGTDTQVGASADSRGLTFSDDGNRMYLVTRTPPVLQLYDTSLAPGNAFPTNQLLGGSDICRDSSNVAVLNFDKLGVSLGEAINERAYVTCFDDNVIYVIDPNGTTNVDDIIPVGRGPFAVAVSPKNQLVFVTDFLEDTIAVIDVSPTSPRRNRVVIRIGTPKAPTV